MTIRQILLLLFLALYTFSCKESKVEPEAGSSSASTFIELIDAINNQIATSPNDANNYAARARLYYEQKRYDNAIIDLQKAINLDSLNTDHYHNLSDIYLEYYKSKNAIKTLERASVTVRDKESTLIKLAKTYAIVKQYKDAHRSINRLLTDDPANSEAYFLRAIIHKDQGDISKCIENLKSCVELDADQMKAWILLGELLGDMNNPDALVYFDNALRIDPNNVHALHSKAFYLQNNDNLLEAIKVYKSIIRIQPDYVDAYFNAGILYLELDSLEQAKRHFNLSINIEPSKALAYYYRGLTYEVQGDQEEALNDYNQTLQLQPENTKAQKAIENIERNQVVN